MLSLSCVHGALNPLHFTHGDVDPDDPGKKLKSPVPYNRASVSKGKAMFAKYCVRCHGVKGVGNGPESEEITPKPSDLTRLSNPSDTYLFKKISARNDEMPTWDIKLKKKQIWYLTVFKKVEQSADEKEAN